jgi:hypothetical protein
MILKHDTTYTFRDALPPTYAGAYPIVDSFFEFFGSDLALVETIVAGGVRIPKQNVALDRKARVLYASVPESVATASLIVVTAIPALTYLRYLRNNTEGLRTARALEQADGVRRIFTIQPAQYDWSGGGMIATIANGTFTSVTREAFDRAEPFEKVFYLQFTAFGVELVFKYPPCQLIPTDEFPEPYGQAEAVVSGVGSLVPVPSDVYVKYQG